MDEVKSIEDDSRLELEDLDLPASSEVGLSPGMSKDESKAESVNYLAGLHDKSTHSANEDVPTAFRNLQADLLKQEAKKPTKPPPRAPAETSEPVRSSLPDKTKAISENESATVPVDASKTIAVEGARGRPPALPLAMPAVERSQVVSNKSQPVRAGQAYIGADASLAQAETLKLAQDRIKELEKEVDRLRQDNDDLASAGEIITQKMEDFQGRVVRLEKEKSELNNQFKNEVLILKGHLQFKDNELSKSKTKVEELDLRIKTDFKKIRVRERELENRLELVRAEKYALMRSKDEKILDLQRKLDQMKSELDLYRSKVQDLNKSMEEQQDQMRKTVRALRVAMSNLENDSPMDDARSVVAADPSTPKNENPNDSES
ncbi:MAG: hypothetical protein ACK5V3_14680 [Bdellovibrionales bacterium]